MAEKSKRGVSKDTLGKRINMIVQSEQSKQRLLAFLDQYDPLLASLDSVKVSARDGIAVISVSGGDFSEKYPQSLHENGGTVQEQSLDTKLLEQLLEKLVAIEERIHILLKHLKRLNCDACKGPLVRPEITDIGELLCKTCCMKHLERGCASYPVIRLMECPVEHDDVDGTVSCSGDSPDQSAGQSDVESVGGGSSTISDGYYYEKPLSYRVAERVRHLTGKPHRVSDSLIKLIEFTTQPGGKSEVFKAGAIGQAAKLLSEKEHKNLALELLRTLTNTTEKDSDLDRKEAREICHDVADYLDDFMKIMEQRELPEALIAAEIVVNMLTDEAILHTVRTKYRIVKTLVELLGKDSERADSVRLQGLARLTKVGLDSFGGTNNEFIAQSLLTLLEDGLKKTDLEYFVSDSLEMLQVLLNSQVSPLESGYSLIRGKIIELLSDNKFDSVSGIPEKTAVITIMTETLRKEDITKNFVTGVVNMIEWPKSAVFRLKTKESVELINAFLALLSILATHEEEIVREIICSSELMRTTLTNIATLRTSKISLDSRVKLLVIFSKLKDKITLALGVNFLLGDMAATEPCKEKIAAGLREIVETQNCLDEKELERVRDKLLELLKETNKGCQEEALVALQALPPGVILAKPMPLATLLECLGQNWSEKTRNVAIRLLFFYVKEDKVKPLLFQQLQAGIKNLLGFLRDKHGKPDSQEAADQAAFAILKIAATKNEVDVRHEINMDALEILVDRVKNRGTEDLKELLVNLLVLILERATENKDRFVTMGAHTFMTHLLKNERLKFKAMAGLKHLVTHEGAKKALLESGFVEKAVEIVSEYFAPTEVAYILKEMASTPEGLKEICGCLGATTALVTLLQHCSEPEGKGFSAFVIRKVYLYLMEEGDPGMKRQGLMSNAICYLLVYLEQGERTQIEEVLKTLAALATENGGKDMIREKEGVTHLCEYLQNQDSTIQDLVIKVLVKISSVPGGNSSSDFPAQMGHAFVNAGVADKLCNLLKSKIEDRLQLGDGSGSMENLLTLMKNLFTLMKGPSILDGTRSQLCTSQSVEMFLSIVKNYQKFSSIEISLSVDALDACLHASNLNSYFLKKDGVRFLCEAFNRHHTRNSTEQRIITSSILTLFVGDPITSIALAESTRRRACEEILKYEIFSLLNHILLQDERRRPSRDLSTLNSTKYHAGLLVYSFLVFTRRKKGFPTDDTIRALLHASKAECREVKDVANLSLEALRASKEFRVRIDRLSQLQ